MKNHIFKHENISGWEYLSFDITILEAIFGHVEDAQEKQTSDLCSYLFIVPLLLAFWAPSSESHRTPPRTSFRSPFPVGIEEQN